MQAPAGPSSRSTTPRSRSVLASAKTTIAGPAKTAESIRVCRLARRRLPTRPYHCTVRGWAAKYRHRLRTMGLLVLDEDELGALQAFAASIGEVIPETYLVGTGRGFHYYFKTQKNLKLGNAEGAFRGKHINVRGAGGYVVAAGSLHKSGAAYKVVHNVLPADCPQWVIASITGNLRAPAAPALGGQSFDAGLLGGAAHEGRTGYGHRHPTLVSYAGRLRNKGLTYDEATKLFYDRYRDCIQPLGTVPEARYHAPAPRGPNGEQTVSSEVATWASAVAVLRDVYARSPEGQSVPPSSTRSLQSADKLLAELLNVDALANRPRAAPLIEGFLNRRSLARLYGDPGAYKSFSHSTGLSTWRWARPAWSQSRTRPGSLCCR